MSDEESDASSVEEVEEEEEEEITDLSNSDVCTKYQEASKIVNLALTGLVSQCLPGAKIIDLCQFGTSVIESQAAKLYTKKVKGAAVDRGVAFPVCISVNDVICNHSPLSSEELEPLKAGDIVKIDLGCHIDGFISVAAHTLIVPAGPDAAPEVDDEIGNVAVAAYNAMLVAANAIAAGAKNNEVTAAVERVATAYGVNPISTVRMHQMKRFVIDGVKEVALKEPTADDIEEGEEKVPECSFEQSEVYAVDVAMSTGDGKVRPGDLRTTVFKRNVETSYRLKMKAARYVLSEVDKKFPTLPFTLRHFDDERQAKMGIQECVTHGLLTPYPSLHEKGGAKVAHFKCTVLLLPSGTSKVTGLEMPGYFKTDKTPDEETAKVLADIAERAAKKAKKKAAKKKKKKAGK
uniref:Peptidase M24 domain-containing protein n=1 Tax=Trieres chinensis TaxID=1514140 RepID=A0A7S2A2K4_TRICV|mmetsp:Transcript_38550/g.78630  ORF Transcript_38550/g.78630 Transcript_38550/m.78630 type:complete len:405 (+) Transcript_38550:118-1332(+)|eukprot:CAMPEP_0183297930 /NCGR_PEP_ID=MMETSP0160_2-20130417/5072_1 /TAXON_ID=2839 ORGANISM="Odontella Sinensis, Strain Grunow 1884" /NCGR_SAMPLE_ID=MMETSP0160_2 /ASSEMBLY_ACC=CAM_ASM_000250 /LENGTH=404 /DNA_ID=CAMNT_0025459835 /DNA_START=118 /DNA_END=1332 /DNA_ORIENTATION=-